MLGCKGLTGSQNKRIVAYMYIKSMGHSNKSCLHCSSPKRYHFQNSNNETSYLNCVRVIKLIHIAMSVWQRCETDKNLFNTAC